jgi:aminoglycoside phosphotransferase (APT) family kinase protein
MSAKWIALQGALAQATFTAFSGQHRSMVHCERRPFAYRSSFPLEELRVVLDDGTTVSMLFKDLGPQGVSDEAVRAKPSFLYDPLREILVYRALLGDAGLGTAVCYGAVTDAAAGWYWLFLEKVAGVELYQVGDLAVWQRAAGWLADLHQHFAVQVHHLPADVRRHLVCYDGALYRRWLERAVTFVSRATQGAGDGSFLAPLAARYDRVLERLVSLPTTLLHGEFYPANILVQGERICAVDWEMAAVGPGLVDLAAFTAGQWTEEERLSLASAYHEALRKTAASPQSLDRLLEDLDYCRLHLAVQWLGWSSDWTPPPHQVHDWLAEARLLSGKLGLLGGSP